jgi:hypothetical protein
MSLFSVDVINPDMTGRPAHARIGERIRTAIASGALAQRARITEVQGAAFPSIRCQNTARSIAEGWSLATPARRAKKRENA